MAGLLVLSEDEVRRLIDLDELAEALEAALVALAGGTCSVPPRIAAVTPAGLLAAMPGYVPGAGLAAKLVSVYPHNAARRLPSHQALLAVFDEETGSPAALLGGTYVTAIRTAVVAAIAARALAPPEAGTVAVVGAGVQGAAHVTAFRHLLRPAEIRVTSRDPAKAAALAGDAVLAVASAEEAVRGAGVVCCCTDAPSPVIADEWVGRGAHVSSVGSGGEIPAATVARARVVVESRAATLPPPAGAVELQGADPEALVELGAVLAGRAEGRRSPAETTLYKSTGHAVEDVATAALVLRRAREAGAGTIVDLGD